MEVTSHARRVLPPCSMPVLELITCTQMLTLQKISFGIISLVKPLNILVINSSLPGVKGLQPLSSLFKASPSAGTQHFFPTPTKCRSMDLPAWSLPSSWWHSAFISRRLRWVLARDKATLRRAKSQLRFAEFGHL